MKIWVITALFPTKAEPYRGAAIWSTLRELRAYADVEAFCPLARYPRWLRPKNFRYHDQRAEPERYGITAQTVEYPAIPWLSRSTNGGTIYRRLRRTVPETAPDVILGFYIYPEAYAAVRLGESLGVPVVVSSRGSDLRLIEANPFIQRMTRAAVRKAAGVWCVSSDLAEIAARLGAAPDRVHTIRNGVDGEVFAPRPLQEARAALQVDGQRRLVLFVGWLSALKGVPQLLEAMAQLNRKGDDWDLALIGEGSIEAALRARARELGIEQRVRFVGAQNAQQIATWMNASDYLCLPSDSEGCPNVVVEALSCGTPVVANTVGGIPELMNERSGVLMPNNTAVAIAEALEKAASITWNREQIAQENSRSWKQVARETLQVCEQVMRSRAAAPVQLLESSYGTRG